MSQLLLLLLLSAMLLRPPPLHLPPAPVLRQRHPGLQH